MAEVLLMHCEVGECAFRALRVAQTGPGQQQILQ